MNCRICSALLKNPFPVKEMMYGTEELFEYYRCQGCGSLQIKEIPENLHEYYPVNYHKSKYALPNIALQYARFARDKYSFIKKGILGKVIQYYLGKNDNTEAFYRLSQKISFNKDKVKVLDIGCGNGGFVYFLYKLGYKHILGIDPFIANKDWNQTVKLEKKTVHNLNDTFDLIVSNHSLEHVPDFVNDFEQISLLLNDGGIFFLRLPIVGLGYDIYKENWVQIDAPRHITIPSLDALKQICEKMNLSIVEYFYDTTELLFKGSELYQKGLSLKHKNIFTKKEIYSFRKKAFELNQKNLGDQICMIIRK